MSKVFIIGLPRTGTTSISVAMLDYGFKVAHTAYTKHAFDLADIISDSPCFCDYKQLDKLYPNAKFVYLERDLTRWVPSMQMLIGKMKDNLDLQTGQFNLVLKRTFNQVFELDKTPDPMSEMHLIDCYQRHKEQVFTYFSGRDDLLSIDVSDAQSLMSLLQFLNIGYTGEPVFPHLNIGKKVACWEEHKHPNKINANSAGPESRKFFSYADNYKQQIKKRR